MCELELPGATPAPGAEGVCVWELCPEFPGSRMGDPRSGQRMGQFPSGQFSRTMS